MLHSCCDLSPDYLASYFKVPNRSDTCPEAKTQEVRRELAQVRGEVAAAEQGQAQAAAEVAEAAQQAAALTVERKHLESELAQVAAVNDKIRQVR